MRKKAMERMTSEELTEGLRRIKIRIYVTIFLVIALTLTAFWIWYDDVEIRYELLIIPALGILSIVSSIVSSKKVKAHIANRELSQNN